MYPNRSSSSFGFTTDKGNPFGDHKPRPWFLIMCAPLTLMCDSSLCGQILFIHFSTESNKISVERSPKICCQKSTEIATKYHETPSLIITSHFNFITDPPHPCQLLQSQKTLTCDTSIVSYPPECGVHSPLLLPDLNFTQSQFYARTTVMLRQFP